MAQHGGGLPAHHPPSPSGSTSSPCARRSPAPGCRQATCSSNGSRSLRCCANVAGNINRRRRARDRIADADTSGTNCSRVPTRTVNPCRTTTLGARAFAIEVIRAALDGTLWARRPEPDAPASPCRDWATSRWWTDARTTSSPTGSASPRPISAPSARTSHRPYQNTRSRRCWLPRSRTSAIPSRFRTEEKRRAVDVPGPPSYS